MSTLPLLLLVLLPSLLHLPCSWDLTSKARVRLHPVGLLSLMSHALFLEAVQLLFVVFLILFYIWLLYQISIFTIAWPARHWSVD